MVIPSLSLKGKVALVTGGKRGIGRGVALTLAEAGADVAVCSRGVRDKALETVAKEIQQLGRRSLAIHADVSKKSDVENMVQRVTDELGEIDILVNSAGVLTWGPSVLDSDEDLWDRHIDINLKGYYLCAQAVGKRMVARKKGNIIMVTSGGAVSPVPGAGVYCVSKAGVSMLIRILALELAKYNIRVNGIAPAWVKTDMNIEIRTSSAVEKQIARAIPLGRLGEPEDMGRVAVYLASDVSEYVTGQVITADGGMIDQALSTWSTSRLFDPYTSAGS